MISAMLYLSFFAQKSRVNGRTGVMRSSFLRDYSCLPSCILVILSSFLTNVKNLTKYHDNKVLLFYYHHVFGGRMFSEMVEKKSNFDLTSKSAFSSEDDTFTSRSIAALLAKNAVPSSHKRIADNYFIIKKVFKFQACMSRISNVEKSVLEKYDFNTLEFTTMKQMYSELELLQQWSSSNDEAQKEIADNILLIRVKELKFLEASRYASISNEIYNGYMALEQYLKEISKFQTVKNMRVYY